MYEGLASLTSVSVTQSATTLIAWSYASGRGVPFDVLPPTRWQRSTGCASQRTSPRRG